MNGPVKNFGRAIKGQGALVSARVSIGYDAPWRQVHALLLDAARETPGIRADPVPYVLQRALDDFYVQYELVAAVENPVDRPLVASALHARIQDGFNAAGLQIMSPHFALQPRKPVLAEPPASAVDPQGPRGGSERPRLPEGPLRFRAALRRSSPAAPNPERRAAPR